MPELNRVRAVFAAFFFASFHAGLLAAEPAKKSATPTRFYNRVAVITIGINDFWDTGIPDLAAAENDARKVHNLFHDHYGYDCQAPLLGAKATRESIRKAVRDTVAALSADDALILFIASHGQRIEKPGAGAAGFVVPHDAALSLDEKNLAIWEEQALPIEEFTALLRGPNGKHVVLLLDTCCSGIATHRGNLANRPDLQVLASLGSRIAIAATTDNKPSLENLGKGYGLFTEALVDQLRTNRASSMTEVFEAVRRRVVRDSSRLMVPQMGHFGDGEGEFVFIPKEISKEEIAEATKEAFTRFASRGARLSSIEDVIASYEALDFRFSAEPGPAESNWKDRFRRFEDNAAISDPLALVGLHYCYSKGLGTDKDLAAAHRVAVQAFTLGNPSGKHVLGRCYLDGIGVERNQIAAKRLIKEAAEAGFPISCYSMGRLTLFKPPQDLTADDIATAKTWFEKASAGGVSNAASNLAVLYMGTIPKTRADIPKALALLTAAAKSGNAEAQFGLSDLYISGKPGYPAPDVTKSRDFLEQSAAAGWGDAQHNLGCEYYQSRGINGLRGYTKDFVEARRWFELAAKQGYARSLLMLCTMHEKGEGGPVDLDSAKKMCEAAAATNAPGAFVQLGKWFYDGTVYPQDRMKAMQNYRRAAEMGDSEGCYFVGEMHWQGQGINKDIVDNLIAGGYSGAKILPPFQPHALYWFIRAEKAGGDVRATNRLKEFAKYYRRPLLGTNGVPPVDYDFFSPQDVVAAFRKIYKEGAEYQALQSLLEMK